MSGVAIINFLLRADSVVVAAVGTANIKSGVLPKDQTLPAIAITSISAVDRNIIDPASTVRVRERVQVTVLASTYPALKPIMQKVRHACRDKRSATGFTGVLVLTDGTGPDDFGDELGLYLQTQDFLVTFDETH